MENNKCGFNTKLIHAGDMHDEWGSAVTPIYQTSTFAFKSAKHGADCFAGKEKGLRILTKYFQRFSCKI